MAQYRHILVLTLGLLFIAGCSSIAPNGSVQNVPVDRLSAFLAYERATTRDATLYAMRLLKTYAQQNPGEYSSRARLANTYTLFGAGFSQSSREREQAYADAMAMAEEAMLTSPEYAAAREAGKRFTEALVHLDNRHLEALEFWKTALFYDFREATGLIAKITRYRRLKAAVAVMQRIKEIDRTAIAGSNLFSEGIYYLAQPKFAGGDIEKSRMLLNEAVDVGGGNLLPRWGRAKYYAVKMRDLELYKSDLQWVIAQPLGDLPGFRPWNHLLSRESEALLLNPAAEFNRP